MGDIDVQALILRLSVLVIAITIHEFAHAITADKLGDPTPRSQGRISLLPPDHLDPLGTIMMVLSSIAGWGLGWGKPVMTNPGNFKNPRRDSGIVAIAGPISNILQAILFSLVYRAFMDSGSDLFLMFLRFGVTVNLSLAIFNMIPVAPLDGHWVMTSILPREAAVSYMNWNRAYGMYVFLGLVLFNPQHHILTSLLLPPIQFGAHLLLPMVFQ
jgi:Zn-dependent protease